MKVALTIRPDDFLVGFPCNPFDCPTHVALRRLLRSDIHLIVQQDYIFMVRGGQTIDENPELGVNIALPDELQEIIYDNDIWGHSIAGPMTFTLDIPKEYLSDNAEEAKPRETNTTAAWEEAVNAA